MASREIVLEHESGSLRDKVKELSAWVVKSAEVHRVCSDLLPAEYIDTIRCLTTEPVVQWCEQRQREGRK